MSIRALCNGRAYDLVRSGSFDHIAQIKHQLNAEGHDINDLNDRGLVDWAPGGPLRLPSRYRC